MSNRRGPKAKKADRNVTIRDVASAASVSIGTVSRVLTGKAAVSDGLRDNVLTAVEKLGYLHANAVRAAPGKTTGFIGCLIPDITNPVYAAYVSGAELKAREAGFNLVVGATGNDSFRERGMLGFLSGGRIDGAMILIGEESQPDLRKLALRLGVPAVIVERMAPDDSDAVQVDHRAATREATNYLISLGHRRMALLTSAPHIRTTTERIAGMKAAASGAGVSASNLLLFTEVTNTNIAFAVASEMLRADNPPTAILCIAPCLAGVLRAVKEQNLRYPEDVSIICLGESDLAALVEPQVTVLAWDPIDLGRTAIDLVINRINRRIEGAGRRILISCELKLRGSCACPAGASALTECFRALRGMRMPRPVLEK